MCAAEDGAAGVWAERSGKFGGAGKFIDVGEGSMRPDGACIGEGEGM